MSGDNLKPYQGNLASISLRLKTSICFGLLLMCVTKNNWLSCSFFIVYLTSVDVPIGISNHQAFTWNFKDCSPWLSNLSIVYHPPWLRSFCPIIIKQVMLIKSYFSHDIRKNLNTMTNCG